MKLDARLLPRTKWFLDYDGSLCPHLEVWEERSYEPADIWDLVSKLLPSTAGIYWNTGRRPESLAGLNINFMEIPGYFIHGSVYWDPKTKKEHFLAPTIPAEIVRHFESVLKSHRELRLEKKPTGIRVAPVHANSQPRMQAFLNSADFTTPAGWEWTIGARGAELLAQGFKKDSGLRREIQEGIIPVAVGDDVFDGPAFEAALSAGGFAVVVGENCGFITKIPHQSWQIVYCDNSQAALKFLRDLVSV